MPDSQPGRPLQVALAVFVLAAAAAASLIWRVERGEHEQRRARAAYAAADHADALQRSIERSASATFALAALVRQGKGSVPGFAEVAGGMLPLYPGVSALALVPGGVIRDIAPLAGNEKALGHNLLQDPARNKEAFVARDSGKLTLAGPLHVVQGGLGVVGRLPVFLDDAAGKPYFWGLVQVVVFLPQVLESAGLSQLTGQGYAYELWRLRPDSGEKQIIAASSPAALIDPVEHALQVPNGTWTLSVTPVAGWRDVKALVLEAGLGLLFGLLLAYLAKLLLELRAHQHGLEALVTERFAEIQAREADLNRAQSVSHTGSWVLDVATREMRGSAEAMRILGRAGSGQISYKAFLRLVHADDREAVDLASRASFKGAPYDIDYRIVVGAATRWVHSNAELMFGADGRLTHALGTIQDVTERKRTEQALHESEERFRSLTEMSSDFYWESDAEHRLTARSSANKKLSTVSMFRKGAQIGERRWEIPYLSPDEAGWQAHRATLDAHLPFRNFELSRLGVDRTERHISISGDPVFDASGGFAGYRGVGTDITEHKRAEARLRLAASVFEYAQEAIIITDADANIIAVNRRFVEITGYTAEEAVGHNPRMLKSGRQGGDFYRAMWASIRTDGYWAGELWNRRKDGRVFPESISISTVRDDRGRVINYVAVFMDISQRIAAEQALRESEHVYRTMFDSAPEGVWMIGPDRRTTAVNPKICDLLGYAREDMLGRDPIEFADEENGRIFRANAQLAPSRETRTYEVAVRHRDGHNIPAEFSTTCLFNEDGSLMAKLAFVVDLTERKRHEDALLRLNEELERRVAERTHALEVTNSELEIFSYSVSHDLRAPLRAIHGFSSLVQAQYADQIDERGRDMLRRVGAGAERMGHLIDDLLKLSNISRHAMRIGPVDLSALARELTEELNAGETDRRAQWIIAPRVVARGDAGLLRVALQNLLGNAWKYSSRREVARIEFGVAEREGHPVYFVRDNGAGFDMAYASKLFKAFQRLHSPAEFPGTGIGLATVARIVHRHGGEVWAEGRVGEGSIFYFSLG